MEEPTLFDYDPRAHARTADPDTSHEAAARVTTLNNHCGLLLRAYRGAEMTAEEAAEAAGITPWAASKRVSDLRRMALIEPVIIGGERVTRRNSSNRQAEVCRITLAGRNRLEEMP